MVGRKGRLVFGFNGLRLSETVLILIFVGRHIARCNRGREFVLLVFEFRAFRRIKRFFGVLRLDGVVKHRVGYGLIRRCCGGMKRVVRGNLRLRRFPLSSPFRRRRIGGSGQAIARGRKGLFRLLEIVFFGRRILECAEDVRPRRRSGRFVGGMLSLWFQQGILHRRDRDGSQGLPSHPFCRDQQDLASWSARSITGHFLAAKPGCGRRSHRGSGPGVAVEGALSAAGGPERGAASVLCEESLDPEGVSLKFGKRAVSRRGHGRIGSVVAATMLRRRSRRIASESRCNHSRMIVAGQSRAGILRRVQFVVRQAALWWFGIARNGRCRRGLRRGGGRRPIVSLDRVERSVVVLTRCRFALQRE